ncbi:MAG: Chemotaxis protein CheW [Syntrophus sp. SKADARSKE-3]|nr:Chemotaxis protein CheW [Syntrophus sp. SKADARSKE-3]
MEQAASNVGHRAEVMTDLGGKYLTFILQNEVYGIGIKKVKEIIGLIPITTVPKTPDFVKGVINLRGKVIPVIDLRSRFRMVTADYTDHTCIIVVEITLSSRSVPVGIVVDEVSEVLNIKGGDIDETPSFGVRLEMDFILGMAKAGDGVKTLLDIDRVLTNSELQQLHAA